MNVFHQNEHLLQALLELEKSKKYGYVAFARNIT